MQSGPCSSFFFFNDTATTEIYTLSLHDALPICLLGAGGVVVEHDLDGIGLVLDGVVPALHRGLEEAGRPGHGRQARPLPQGRSEEHTSELQSHSDLVCRLLLEKKKKTNLHSCTV